MKIHLRTRTSLLVMLVAALMLAACGDSGSGGDGAGSGDTASGATAADGTDAGTGTADSAVDEGDASTPSSTGSDAGPEGDTATADPDDDTSATTDEVPAGPVCADGLPVRPFDDGPAGSLRHELMGDFTIPLTDGTGWTFSEEWTGCEVLVFIPDTISRSQLDSSSIWTGDVDALIQRSPTNVHYFFVSRLGSEAAAKANIDAMHATVQQALDGLPGTGADFWTTRLHVVSARAAGIVNPLSSMLTTGIGQAGFTVDRFQQIRGIGSFADVFRFQQALSDAEAWPWESNLAYGAHDPTYLNGEAAWVTEMNGQDALEIELFAGEVIEGFAETEVELPDAETLAGFDTFEVYIDMRCPNPALPEPGNCGAWDYLAHLSIYDGEDRVEIGRFITSYHRETRWLHDLTPMLPQLMPGGTRTMRWEWAPSWNVQPTATRLKLRFSNRAKADKPFAVSWLYAGGGFNAAYNEAHEPLEVAVPADATRVELYATISGHGADTSQCAEFCNHWHEWTVNGAIFTEKHDTVGIADGCVGELTDRMIPNQWGTWWFGRGGWCPGQPVKPWVVDVTDLVTPGEPAAISYRGLLSGFAPPDNAGNINMTSYLIYYR